MQEIVLNIQSFSRKENIIPYRMQCYYKKQNLFTVQLQMQVGSNIFAFTLSDIDLKSMLLHIIWIYAFSCGKLNIELNFIFCFVNSCFVFASQLKPMLKPQKSSTSININKFPCKLTFCLEKVKANYDWNKKSN